jgi:PEP-CTERM/exosortase A-associated glycosyltransferase
MHVLHVLDHTLPLHSGYAFRSASIVAEQRSNGWQVSLLTGTRHAADGPLQEVMDGSNVYRTPICGGVLNRLPLLNQYAAIRNLKRRLEQVLGTVKPDVIHAHSPCLNGIAACQAAREFRIPFVYEMRASWEDAAVTHGTTREGSIRYRLSRQLETYVLRRAQHITTICQGLRRDIESRGIDSGKITLIPNAVSLSDFEFGAPKDAQLASTLDLDDTVVLGFIGSFYHYEGLPVLQEGLAMLRQAGVRVKLLLAGGGLAERALREQARRLGIDEYVRAVGRVPHANISRYYDLVDIFVYPRLSTRLTEMVTPLKPLEAMAKGKLVVASDVGGHRELIRDGETGFLFPANDAGALAHTLQRVLQLRGQWGSVRDCARQYVETHRTWPISVAGYQSVYERVLKPQGSGRTRIN